MINQFNESTLLLCRYLTSKEQFHAYLKAEGESRNQENNQHDGEEDSSSNDQTEPPAKQMKLDSGDQVRKQGSQEEVVKEEEKKPQERKRARGQNKSRPCMKPNHYEKDRLCQSVIQVSGWPAMVGDFRFFR